VPLIPIDQTSGLAAPFHAYASSASLGTGEVSCSIGKWFPLDDSQRGTPDSADSDARDAGR
jgi:hypothetical protein